MAEEKKKKPNVFVRMGRSIKKWFREMRSELKKVVWPTAKQTTNNTIVVLVVILIASIVVWGFDELASLAINAIISIGG
jgi:preprotein translocase subunit SecE